MATQADHFQAARNELLNKRRDAEAEIREINEALAGLDAAARKLTGKPGAHFKSEPEEKASGTRTLANRDVTKKVREWLAVYNKHDEKIEVNTIRDDLKRQGVKGKDRSLYSAIHVILKEEADAGRLAYRKGFGFFKSRQDPSRLTHEDRELVHTSYSSL